MNKLFKLLLVLITIIGLSGCSFIKSDHKKTEEFINTFVDEINKNSLDEHNLEILESYIVYGDQEIEGEVIVSLEVNSNVYTDWEIIPTIEDINRIAQEIFIANEIITELIFIDSLTKVEYGTWSREGFTSEMYNSATEELRINEMIVMGNAVIEILIELYDVGEIYSKYTVEYMERVGKLSVVLYFNEDAYVNKYGAGKVEDGAEFSDEILYFDESFYQVKLLDDRTERQYYHATK